VEDGSRAREVAADGTTTAEVELSPGIYPVAAMEGGLLVDAAGTLVLHDAGSGRGTRVGAGRLVTADAGHLARWVCDDARLLAGVWDPSGRWLFAPDTQGVRVWDVRENSVAAIDVDRPVSAFVVQ
jgi:sugar lactone lactonase YvrE